jgi:UDP-2,3-diacylglucosamine pyrophosphatase LpxH
MQDKRSRQAMTTTLIISDVHLGARNSQTSALSALLATDFDRLILNGDTVDNLNFRRFNAGHWAVVDQLRSIARERRLILIRGNHEGMGTTSGSAFGPLDVLAQLLETELHDEYHLVVARRRYLVFHGDRFDRTLRMTWVGDVADAFYNRVQVCSKSLARWLKRRSKDWGGVVSSVRRGAVEYARQNQCQGVIMGHTHFPEDEFVGGIHYLNTGCWVEQPCTYLRIENNQIRLCQWDDTSSLPQPDLVPHPVPVRKQLLTAVACWRAGSDRRASGRCAVSGPCRCAL